MVTSGGTDPANDFDRRRVWVHSRNDAIEPIVEIFMPSQRHMYELWHTFSAKELDVIASFLERTTKLAAACAEEIRQQAKPTGKRRRNNSQSDNQSKGDSQ